MTYLVCAVIMVIIGGIWFLIFFRRNKKQLKKCDLKDFSCHLKKISHKKVSQKEKIIDYDKVYHKILLKAWYNGSFWDILKQNPREISDLNKIWELHKIRNHLVHEMWEPKWVDLEETSQQYKKELSKILKAFSK